MVHGPFKNLEQLLDLNDVGTDNHSFVAVGHGGKLIRSVDNGTTWTTPSTWGQSSLSGTTIDLDAVAGQVDNISGNNDFVVVTNTANGKVGYSRDNGSTWSTGPDTAQIEIAYGDDFILVKNILLQLVMMGIFQISENGGASWTKKLISLKI